jgi:hypothetical protein
MTDRRTGQSGDSGGLALTAAIAALVIGFLAVRWLARLNPLALAALAATVVVIVAAARAMWPRRHLPRNRVRHMRLRARMRLHPGPGHATAFELWLRWGRLAAARRARRSRRSLTWRQRQFCPAETSVLVARAHYQHALRVPVEEHVIWIGPPRSGKTGPLASIIADYPGPVVVTTTRADLYELTPPAPARSAARCTC